jgi:hypothetical protein
MVTKEVHDAVAAAEQLPRAEHDEGPSLFGRFSFSLHYQNFRK